MANTVRLTIDNMIELMTIPWEIGYQEAVLCADFTEVVQTQIMCDLFNERIVMLVDGAGAIMNKPTNQVASYLYGAQNHGFYIHGDVIFALQDGPNTNCLEDAERIMSVLKANFSILKEVGRRQVERQKKGGIVR